MKYKMRTMQLSEIYKPICKDLKEVDSMLKEQFHSTDESLKKIRSYTFDMPCKRLRPALVLLSAGINGRKNKAKAKSLACAVELIHTASLVHNDIIDDADMRRGKKTINSEWGNRISTIFGDRLFHEAFSHLLRIKSHRILSIISSATAMLCEGEMKEIKNLYNSNLSQKSYLDIVKKKTASLFSCSCEAGALVGGAKTHEVAALNGYGLNIGMAFQITDDCLDIVGNDKVLGKKTGMDIKNGRITLPLIRFFSSVSRKEKTRFVNLLKSGKDGEYTEKLKDMIVDCGAVDSSFTIAHNYVSTAKKNIEVLGTSVFRKSLDDLCEYIMKRNH